jgi:hypothetical protein
MWFLWLSQHRKRTNMAINFPIRSCSYDARRRAVRFWGYDRSMESSFFMMADALKQMQPNLHSMRPNFCVLSISTATASTLQPRKYMPEAEEAPTI